MVFGDVAVAALVVAGLVLCYFPVGVLACNNRLLFIARYAGDRLDVALSAQQRR